MKKVIIIIVSLLVIGLGSYFIFDKVIKKSVEKSDNKEEINDISKEEETKQNNGVEYTYEEKDNGDLIFYKDGEVVSEYKCDGIACEIDFFNFETRYPSKVVTTPKTYILGNKVLIANCDGETCEWIDGYGGWSFLYVNDNDVKSAYGKVLLYDIPTGEYKEYDNVKHIMLGMGDDVRILELLNDEYIIVSKDGKIDRKFNYDDYVFVCYEGCFLSEYMYNENVIIYKQNGKYGIQRLDNGEIILNAMYDDMRFSGDKYYIAKINDQYNLYNTSDNRQVTKNGYDKIFFVNEELLLVYKDKEISFINLKEEKLINDTIHVDNIYSWMPKNSLGVIAYVDDNNICHITISDGTLFENKKDYGYTFDLNTHELIKTDEIQF